MACTAKLGILAYVITQQSCNGQLFLSLLDKIALKHPNATLLIDSASYHKSIILRNKIEELGMKPIYNSPYCLELAAHEIVIKLIKH